LQQIKKKAETESKNCHGKTMLSLKKPIKLKNFKIRRIIEYPDTEEEGEGGKE
jgi:hypothetical protein